MDRSLEMAMLSHPRWAQPGLFWKPIGPEQGFKRVGDYEIDYKTWTRALRELERQGLTEKFVECFEPGSFKTEQFKTRTYYRITPKGRELLLCF